MAALLRSGLYSQKRCEGYRICVSVRKPESNLCNSSGNRDLIRGYRELSVHNTVEKMSRDGKAGTGSTCTASF